MFTMDLEALKGVVREYGTQTGDPNTKRVEDVVVYMEQVWNVDNDPECDPDHVTKTRCLNTLDGYLLDGPEVEDNWTQNDTRTVLALIGYLTVYRPWRYDQDVNPQ